jgi:DNA mismatch repair ATPase MutL
MGFRGEALASIASRRARNRLAHDASPHGYAIRAEGAWTAKRR